MYEDKSLRDNLDEFPENRNGGSEVTSGPLLLDLIQQRLGLGGGEGHFGERARQQIHQLASDSGLVIIVALLIPMRKFHEEDSRAQSVIQRRVPILPSNQCLQSDSKC